jgi:hypothetical protein
MGHPIFKHMSSSQRYDNKQAYNKDLSDSARLHYLENEEHDKGMSRKSSPANVKGSQSDHGQSSKEFADHEARVGTDGHGPSRKSSPLNDKLPGKGAHPHNASGDHKKDFKKPTTKKGVSRKVSPLDATRAERRISKTKDKAAEAKKDASRTNKEGGTIETQARARAKAKRLDKRAERQENRAGRKEKRKSKKAKLSKANRGVAVTSVGSVKSSGIKKDVKSSDADVQDSTRAKVKKSLA